MKTIGCVMGQQRVWGWKEFGERDVAPADDAPGTRSYIGHEHGPTFGVGHSGINVHLCCDRQKNTSLPALSRQSRAGHKYGPRLRDRAG